MRLIILIFALLFYGLLAEHFGLHHLVEGVNLVASKKMLMFLFPYALVLDVIDAVKN